MAVIGSATQPAYGWHNALVLLHSAPKASNLGGIVNYGAHVLGLPLTIQQIICNVNVPKLK